MTIGILLSGCGVYDGAEIQESVFTMLAIGQRGGTSLCLAPDVRQHHVIDHRTGNEMPEQRNVLTEAARIARGDIRNVADITIDEIDALVIPGGFGDAKNLTSWAFDGPDGTILPAVKNLIVSMVHAGKPVVGLCMGPTVIAKALEGSGVKPHLTVGTTEEASPYDIAEVNAGMEKLDARTHMNSVREVTIDAGNNIITAPCYMMEASIVDVHDNVQQAIGALFAMLTPDPLHV